MIFMGTYNGKVVASGYEEDVTQYDPEDITRSDFKAVDVIEIDYVTQRGNVKTIRGDQPREPMSTEPDDIEGLVFGYSEKRAYQVENKILTTCDRRRDEQAVLGTGDDIVEIRTVDYPDHVPVLGAPQIGVEAEIYFRSNRSGNIKSKTIEVQSLEASYEGPADSTSSNSILIEGENIADGRSIEASTAWDRALVTSGRQDVEVGKVVRVEFPGGHEFSIKVKNLLDEKVDVAEEKLEEYAQELADRYSENIDEEREAAEVKHLGPIDAE